MPGLTLNRADHPLPIARRCAKRGRNDDVGLSELAWQKTGAGVPVGRKNGGHRISDLVELFRGPLGISCPGNVTSQHRRCVVKNLARPQTQGMRKDKTFEIRISDSQLQALRALAAANNTTPSELLR